MQHRHRSSLSLKLQEGKIVIFVRLDNKPCTGLSIEILKRSVEASQRSFLRRTPLLAGILQNLVNLGLDILLVVFAGWGVKGAASAISVAQASLA